MSVIRSPYRGLFLLTCAVLPAVACYVSRDPRARAPSLMAGIFAVMWFIGIVFGTEAVQAGIKPDFVRWYLIFPQSALILAALCAIACVAFGRSRAAPPFMVGLGVIGMVAAFLAARDLVYVGGESRAMGISRDDLTEVRDRLGGRDPCFLITRSLVIADGPQMFYLQMVQTYKPLQFAEMLTGCTILNGSFTQKGVDHGRDVSGLPAMSVLSALPAGSSIFLIIEEAFKAQYAAAVPAVTFERQPFEIGHLPVWRVIPPS